jgi:CHASE2 domain-containing sensor protein
MVLIDDHSIRQLEPVFGRWPWPRMAHAVLVDFLARGPATLVVYDVLFSEEATGTSDIGGTVWTGSESDDALVESVRRAGNVILAAEASSEGLVDASRNVQPPLDGVPSLQVRWPIRGFAERRPLLTPPFPALAQAARGVGHARLAYDADGPARRYVPFVEVAGHVVPSLPVAAALAVRGTRPEEVSAARAALTLGASRVPWVEQVVPDYYGPPQTVWRGLVPFRGPTMRADVTPTFPSYSFQDVFLAEQQLLEGQTPHLDPAVF